MIALKCQDNSNRTIRCLTPVPLVMTLQLVFMTFLLLSTYEALFAGAIFFTLCLFVPLWVYILQSSKVQLRGPWDIAHVS